MLEFQDRVPAWAPDFSFLLVMSRTVLTQGTGTSTGEKWLELASGLPSRAHGRHLGNEPADENSISLPSI